MEGTSFHQASNSMRRNSSVWKKDSGREIFSRSSREEDDEEALRWAALEKLPTFDRLRKGILTASHAGGPINEIDIQKLGFQDTKKLLERLIKVGDDEHEKLLWKLKKRIDRYANFSLFFFSLAFNGNRGALFLFDVHVGDLSVNCM